MEPKLSCMPQQPAWCLQPYTTGTDEEGVTTESYFQEVQEQLEERGEELEWSQDERVARSAPDNSDGE